VINGQILVNTIMNLRVPWKAREFHKKDSAPRNYLVTVSPETEQNYLDKFVVEKNRDATFLPLPIFVFVKNDLGRETVS
jgi:hypothetical protein